MNQPSGGDQVGMGVSFPYGLLKPHPERTGLRAFGGSVKLMPSFFILLLRVLGLIPSKRAAPSGP